MVNFASSKLDVGVFGSYFNLLIPISCNWSWLFLLLLLIEILLLFENHDITKLDINRIYRYLEKYTNENAAEMEETIIDEDE